MARVRKNGQFYYIGDIELVFIAQHPVGASRHEARLSFGKCDIWL